MKAIIAVNNLGFIGLGTEMLWRSSTDFKHFKAMIEDGTTAICGGNSYDSMGMVQKRITLYRLSRDGAKGLTLPFATRMVLSGDIKWCLGGKQTYELFSPLFTELHISHINDNSIGDVTFPDLSLIDPRCKIYNYNFEINKPKVA